jgi:hypothetical protein
MKSKLRTLLLVLTICHGVTKLHAVITFSRAIVRIAR